MVDVNLDQSTPSNFNLVIPKVPTESELSASNELILNVFSSPIPGISLELDEEHWQGKIVQLPSGRVTFEPWAFSFIVDSDLTNWKLIYEWMMYIANNKDYFTANMRDYAVDSSLIVTDNFRNEKMRIKYRSLWPTTLEEVNFSHREGQNNLECRTTFSYTYFEIKT